MSAGCGSVEAATDAGTGAGGQVGLATADAGNLVGGRVLPAAADAGHSAARDVLKAAADAGRLFARRVLSAAADARREAASGVGVAAGDGRVRCSDSIVPPGHHSTIGGETVTRPHHEIVRACALRRWEWGSAVLVVSDDQVAQAVDGRVRRATAGADVDIATLEEHVIADGVHARDRRLSIGEGSL